MGRDMGKRFSRALFVLALLINVAPAAPVMAAPAGTSETWKAEWERVIAAAKQEGKVVVYGAAGIDRHRVYKDHFEASFPGVKVDYLPTSSAQATSRLVAERRAGKFIPDIYLNAAGATTFPSLRVQNAYQPVRPALLLPEVLDESKWFEGRLWFADAEEKYSLIFSLAATTNIAVNTNWVRLNELTSYKELLDPKWRGKILSQDITQGGPGSGNVKFLYANPHLGPDFLRRLYGEMDVILSSDVRQTVDWLARGRFAILLFPTLNGIDSAREVGLPVDVVPSQQMKEGYALTAGFNHVHLMNPAPHPNAAKVFINWLLSREGQTAFEKAIKTPSLRVDTSAKGSLRDFLVPKKGGNYMVVTLEKYWQLDKEINDLLRSLKK